MTTKSPPPRRPQDVTSEDLRDRDGLAVTLPAKAAGIPQSGDVPDPGTVIAGKYQVVALLGRGSMGAVVRAKDVVLDRDVAVKFILSGSAHPSARDQFLREARAMARVRNENVVAIHEFGDHLGTPYFVMEYIGGPNLGLWLEDRSPLAVDEALGIFRQICSGVDAIHAAGAVHRDLKPSNILMGPGFRIAIGDLGLAELHSTAAGSGDMVAGTPAYMAPEAMSGSITSELATRADVYSLGVLLFELLTGTTPFHAKTIAGMFEAHLTHEPSRPSLLRADLPAALDAPILRALRKEPGDRPGSARELMAGLDSARRSMPPVTGAPYVLVVDDDEDFRILAREAILQAVPGVMVECVANGAEALETMDRNPVSVVLLDLRLPDLSGFEIAAILQSEPDRRHPRMAIVTSVGGASDWRILKELGAQAFLVKPVDPREIGRTVRRLLGMDGNSGFPASR